jgi:hypothetical protein
MVMMMKNEKYLGYTFLDRLSKLSCMGLMMVFVVTASSFAQEDERPARFFTVEFMSVDDTENSNYMQVESFWKEIHQARVANGDIMGWDLFSLTPGGTNQGYQYMTVTHFADPVTMMTGGNFWVAVEEAYQDLPEEEFNRMWEMTASSRDIGERYHMRELDSVMSEDMAPAPGMIMFVDFMKVQPDDYQDYVRAEMDLFRQRHATQIEAGGKEFWSLSSVMVPWGSGVETTHITANAFKNWDQVFNSGVSIPEPDEEMQANMQQALELRDLHKVYVATLVDIVR